jgi:predicted anti-sigma-YlaC factor YlaD
LIRTWACGQLRRELGVYLLGAISPADRSALKSHLASCADCRDQLADLAGLPGLLRRVPLDEMEILVPAGNADGSSTPPDRPPRSRLSRATKRRRYRAS